MDDITVSPTEPHPLRALGAVGSLPDHHSSDVTWQGPNGLVGVQRKTLADLVRSLFDGRLADECARMRLLDVRVLLVEGVPHWSPTRRLVGVRPSITRDQLRGVLWSAQQRGLWVVTTHDLGDTVDCLLHLGRWLAKRRHVAFDRRPTQPGVAGTRAWGAHLLQSFPLVGPVLGGSIWDHFGGVPLAWTCSTDELAAVRGIGPVRARQLATALSPPPSTPVLPLGAAAPVAPEPGAAA